MINILIKCIVVAGIALLVVAAFWLYKALLKWIWELNNRKYIQNDKVRVVCDNITMKYIIGNMIILGLVLLYFILFPAMSLDMGEMELIKYSIFYLVVTLTGFIITFLYIVNVVTILTKDKIFHRGMLGRMRTYNISDITKVEEKQYSSKAGPYKCLYIYFGSKKFYVSEGTRNWNEFRQIIYVKYSSKGGIWRKTLG